MKEIKFTHHAEIRKDQRAISTSKIEMVIHYGTHFYKNGAKVYFVGKKEVEAAKRKGIDLREVENIHVITNPKTGEIITVFKNKSLDRYKC